MSFNRPRKTLKIIFKFCLCSIILFLSGTFSLCAFYSSVFSMFLSAFALFGYFLLVYLHSPIISSTMTNLMLSLPIEFLTWVGLLYFTSLCSRISIWFIFKSIVSTILEALSYSMCTLPLSLFQSCFLSLHY